MAQLRHWALLAAIVGALPVAAEPPRDSVHPGNAEVFEILDPNGLSLLTETRRRTPSGLLYPYPPEPYPLSDLGSGWLGRGALESATSGQQTHARRASRPTSSARTERCSTC
jgi:hypothetical protein